MKKALCCLLIAMLTFSTAACGSQNGGLGQLEMDGGPAKTESKDDSIGKLGGSKETAAPSEGNTTEEKQPEVTKAPVEPTPVPVPTQEPQTGITLVDYVTDDFSMKIPQGWNVHAESFDTGDGFINLSIAVTDPINPNNMIFYIGRLEPYFSSIQEKKALVPYLPEIFQYSPVLNEMSAKGVLEQWASCYTMFDSDGGTQKLPWKNYSVVNYLGEERDAASTDTNVHSLVLAEVTFPTATQTYGLLYENTLNRTNVPNTYFTYYRAFDTRGFILGADVYQEYFDQILQCKLSLDISGFVTKHSAEYENTIDISENLDPGVLQGLPE